jgi:hypothetical protein
MPLGKYQGGSKTSEKEQLCQFPRLARDSLPEDSHVQPGTQVQPPKLTWSWWQWQTQWSCTDDWEPDRKTDSPENTSTDKRHWGHSSTLFIRCPSNPLEIGTTPRVVATPRGNWLKLSFCCSATTEVWHSCYRKRQLHSSQICLYTEIHSLHSIIPQWEAHRLDLTLSPVLLIEKSFRTPYGFSDSFSHPTLHEEERQLVLSLVAINSW